MKALRYALLAVVGLVLLAVVAVAIAVLVIDPNTYKPQIEQAVEQNTNLELSLTGDIGWSLIPLGLELNTVETTLEGEPLLKMQQLVAQVDFWSLITMSPRVNTFVLDGLEARLVVDKNGEGNWTRIMPEPTAEDTAPATASEEEPAPAGDGQPLRFNVEKVRISNADIHYDDLATGQSVTLQDFSLGASQITLGSQFPLDIEFRVDTAQPQMAIDGNLSMRLSASESLREFSVSGLDAQFGLSGEPFGGETVQARLTGSAGANLDTQTASLSDFRATLANLELNASAQVNGFGDKTQVSGKLSIPEFSLKELLSSMGMAPVETDDPTVLNALAFSTDIGGAPGKLALNPLSITLDDTTFSGNASYDLNSGAIQLSLAGDSLNADRYLPPPSDEEEVAAAPADETAEGDLLPLETLRTLGLDIDLGLEKLIIANLNLSDVAAKIAANGGILEVNEFSGKLYQGGFNGNVILDARTDNPSWSLTQRVNDVQTQPLLMDLAELDMLAGGANLNLDLTTRGNRISTLRENADGEIGFNLAKGQFTRMNLTRMACQGIALVNQEQLTTDDWGSSTPFNDMQGTLQVDGNVLTNSNLVAALAGMKLEGEGTIDLAQSVMDYEAGLRIVGEIHRDQACRVTDVVRDVVIPVECRGNFTEDPAGLCSFDGSRFRDTIKDIAANVVRQKVREETDRARDKAEEKVREKVEEQLNKEAGDKVQDTIKGLLGR